MLRIKDLEYEINGKELYRELNLLFGKNQKVALIGRNGCGKTTLFRLIMGDLEPDKGEVQLLHEKVGHLPQILELPENEMVGEFIEKLIPESWEQYRALTILEKLKFENYDEYQLIGTLSEGQKMKLKLCELLLDDPTILLLDEPTNHLDINGIKQFEYFIKHFDGIVIMISHDRAFLNNTVDQVIEIENGVAQSYIGNYDDFVTGKEAWINRNSAEVRVFEKKKQALKKLIANSRKIKDGKKRGKAVRAAKKRYDREITQNEIVKYKEKNIRSLDLEGEVHKHKLIVKFDNLCKSFSTKPHLPSPYQGEVNSSPPYQGGARGGIEHTNIVFNNLSLEIRGRNRVWLFGPNGSGKSTLVKILMDELKQDSGEIKFGTNIRIGYFAQVHDKSIYDRELMEYFMERTGTPYESAFGPLARFLFRKADYGKKIGQMSPGERARLLFAIFTYNEYEFLILDEPTNHLDIPTKELIEKALQEYKGALLLVSHDRYFVEQVGMDKVLELG